MALPNYQVPTRVVGLPNGEPFAVRGLSLSDITILVTRHGDVLRAMFDKFAQSSEENGEVNINLGDIKEVGMRLLSGAPLIAADIIAIGADAPEARDQALKLPFPAQLEALEQIALLTFDTAGGLKKVLEIVIRVLRGMTDLAEGLRTSTPGSTD